MSRFNAVLVAAEGWRGPNAVASVGQGRQRVGGWDAKSQDSFLKPQILKINQNC